MAPYELDPAAEPALLEFLGGLHPAVLVPPEAARRHQGRMRRKFLDVADEFAREAPKGIAACSERARRPSPTSTQT